MQVVMSNYIKLVEKSLIALRVDNSAISKVLDKVNPIEASTSSIFIETRPLDQSKLDITTCHHFTRDWECAGLDNLKFDLIKKLDFKYRPKTVWLEYDDIAESETSPGLHLSVNQQTMVNISELCDILFNSGTPINNEHFERLLQLAEIQHISNLHRDHDETLKLHLKPNNLSSIKLIEEFSTFITDNSCMEMVESVCQLDESYFDYIFLDLSFYNNAPLPIIGIYLSNKNKKSKNYLSDFKRILAFLELEISAVEAIFSLINNEEDVCLDIKIVITAETIYTKLYTGVINSQAVDVEEMAKKLKLVFS